MGRAGERGIGFPYRGNDYAWLTWGARRASWATDASFGVSLDHSYSQNAYLDGLCGVTARASPGGRTRTSASRPSRATSTARAEHSLRRSRTRRAAAAGARRPLHPRRWRSGPRGGATSSSGSRCSTSRAPNQWVPRGTLGVDVPGVGRAFASAEVAHLPNDTQRGVLGTAGLELHFGGLSAGGGALFGNGLGGSRPRRVRDGGARGLHAAGHPDPGARRVDPPREHAGRRAGTSRSCASSGSSPTRPTSTAVTLVLRAEPASSFAHAEELADAIRVLRAHGKKVLCSWEDAGPRALYVCANADRIVVNPAGGVRYAGLKSQYIYLKGLLDKLGVQAPTSSASARTRPRPSSSPTSTRARSPPRTTRTCCGSTRRSSSATSRSTGT